MYPNKNPKQNYDLENYKITINFGTEDTIRTITQDEFLFTEDYKLGKYTIENGSRIKPDVNILNTNSRG